MSLHRHVWKIKLQQEQPSFADQIAELGSFDAKGFGAGDLLRLTYRPVIVTSECVVCGTERVSRV